VKRMMLLAALMVATLCSVGAYAATPVGAVSRVRGECVGLSEGVARTLDPGVPVHLAEDISTGDKARLEIRFEDGTTLTMGENARLVVDTFVFHPAGGLDRLIVSSAGPFRFVSGSLPRQPASTVRVETPLALIGVRGTDFWGGPIDGRYGVFLLEGAVTVSNGAGEAVLDEPGEGVNLDDPDAPPGPVTIWPDDKAERALATVTFN